VINVVSEMVVKTVNSRSFQDWNFTLNNFCLCASVDVKNKGTMH